MKSVSVPLGGKDGSKLPRRGESFGAAYRGLRVEVQGDRAVVSGGSGDSVRRWLAEEVQAAVADLPAKPAAKPAFDGRPVPARRAAHVVGQPLGFAHVVCVECGDPTEHGHRLCEACR